MTRPDNLIENAFLDNLGTDYVAVADNGQIVGRASDEAAIRHAVPDAAHYLTGADLVGLKAVPVTAALSSVDAALDKIKNASPTNSAAIEKQMADAEALRSRPQTVDGSAFDHDGDGHVGGGLRKAPDDEESNDTKSENDAAFNDTAELVPPDETPKPKTTRQRKPAK